MLQAATRGASTELATLLLVDNQGCCCSAVCSEQGCCCCAVSSAFLLTCHSRVISVLVDVSEGGGLKRS